MGAADAPRGTIMKARENDWGMTLIETMIAVLIAMVGIFGLGTLVFQATAINKNQGSETTRSVVYAQDKMEKLLSLAAYQIPGSGTPNFTDCTNAASMPAVCNTTNINDVGWTKGLLAGGSISIPPAPLPFACADLTASQPGYIDYLDINGIQLAQAGTPPVPTPGACGSVPMNKLAYVRQWQITDVTTPGTGPAIKQITVAVYSLSAIAANGGRAVVILTSYIESQN